MDNSNFAPFAVVSLRAPLNISMIIAFWASSSRDTFLPNLVKSPLKEIIAQLITLPGRFFIQSITFWTIPLKLSLRGCEAAEAISSPALYALNKTFPNASPNLFFNNSCFASSVALKKSSKNFWTLPET